MERVRRAYVTAIADVPAPIHSMGFRAFYLCGRILLGSFARAIKLMDGMCGESPLPMQGCLRAIQREFSSRRRTVRTEDCCCRLYLQRYAYVLQVTPITCVFRRRCYKRDQQLKLVARRTGADRLFVLPQGHAVHDAGSHAKGEEPEAASSKPAERHGAQWPQAENAHAQGEAGARRNAVIKRQARGRRDSHSFRRGCHKGEQQFKLVA